MKPDLKILSFPDLTSETEKERFVLSCDRDMELRMEATARRIADESNLKLIGLTGPSCSGKTTAAHKLTQILEETGRTVHVISIDDFYYDTSYLHARLESDPRAEIDFDSEDTIDIDLLREKTESLLAFRDTQLPRFDFPTGKRLQGNRLQPKKTDVFLFEGIQILYPKVQKLLRGPQYRSIYIAPLSAVEAAGFCFMPNEIRLLRRLVRDSIYRSSSVAFSLTLWQSVRNNEELNIFPYSDSCDEYLDSSMAYEIGILKPYLKVLLSAYPPNDPHTETVREILQKIEPVEPISDAYIKENSLYKEFIK